MITFVVVLYLLALVLLGLAAFSVPTGRLAAGWAGLFCIALATVLPALATVLR